MNSNYKTGTLGQSVAALLCAIVVGSTFLLGAVAPAQTVSAATASVTRTAA